MAGACGTIGATKTGVVRVLLRPQPRRGSGPALDPDDTNSLFPSLGRGPATEVNGPVKRTITAPEKLSNAGNSSDTMTRNLAPFVVDRTALPVKVVMLPLPTWLTASPVLNLAMVVAPTLPGGTRSS